MPVLESHDIDIESRHALATAAAELADRGLLGDSVLADPAARLPERLVERLSTVLRPPEPGTGYRVVRGLFAGFTDPGPTPLHWRQTDRARCATLDIALVLVAAQFGRAFGWTDQQDGRIVHNIVPTPGCEDMQIGASSTTELAWHTEDAFHPDRADLLLLACVRNPDGIGSRLSTVAAAGLDERDIRQLLRPEVVILPDDSYEDDTAAMREPVGMATLWERQGSLGLRYDPCYAMLLTEDEQFRKAYERLGHALEAGSFGVPLAPGDLVVIDNDAAVHGRTAFQARYDGTDRWLKRILVRSPRQRPAREALEHGYGQRQVDARNGLSALRT
jgi:hypothetical protein